MVYFDPCRRAHRFSGLSGPRASERRSDIVSADQLAYLVLPRIMPQELVGLDRSPPAAVGRGTGQGEAKGQRDRSKKRSRKWRSSKRSGRTTGAKAHLSLTELRGSLHWRGMSCCSPRNISFTG
jgi:hypothetical protein